MPFDRFLNIKTLSEERHRAVLESLERMPVTELRKIVKELSDFEGDPRQEKFLQIVEMHPEESFYRAVTQEGAIILYCPGENTGVWFLPGHGMGLLPEQANRQMKEAIAAPASRKKDVKPG
jgi:hypothetical protein